MYHRIVSGDATNLYERSVVNLESDLKYIRDKHINVLSINDLTEISGSGQMPLGNSVILTFDDGDYSWVTLVKPLLIKYHMTASFFLWTDMVGHDSFVSWDDVEDMSHYMYEDGARPFNFGSHTFSHQYLLQQKANFSSSEEYNAYLDYQLGKSKEAIQRHVPVNVTALSLPFGDGAGDPVIAEAARRNGYNLVRSSTWGNISSPAFDPMNIPSLPVLDSTTDGVIDFYLNQ